jgi:leucyl aminopeptidase
MKSSFLILQEEQSLFSVESDVLLLPIVQDEELNEAAAAADTALDGLISEMRTRREFRADAFQLEIVPTLGRLPAARLALVGLGKRADLTLHTCRLAVATAARVLGRRGLSRAAVDVQSFPFPPEQVASAVAEGAELARYVPDPFRTGERKEVGLTELRVCAAPSTAPSASLSNALQEGSIRGRAKNLARDLVNLPSNYLDPAELARRSQAMAESVGLGCEVFDEAEMERLRMTSILTVSRGAEAPARFIVLRHSGAKTADGPLLALVGKAVTFDTGGISIKPSADMGKMKTDMAGGAAVVGAMQAIAELGVPVNVIGLVPAAVNMPDGRAWNPGDVVTTRSGKTVETVTTDAEGRMLLADAIDYARELGATHIVDIATLTGACGIALGYVASGLYGTDPDLVEAVRTCGEAAGERHWPMPLFPEYREQNRSEIADLKNSGGRPAGSVTAAWFVREFAGETPWAHLDIAGTAGYEKGKPWAPAGPTGTGVGTFINLAQWLAAR